MASINLEKVKTLYGNNQDLQGQFIDYLRNVESELDFSKFEGLDNQAIFTNLMESGQKEIKVNPNNPAKPLDYRPRREQTYRELKPLDDEIKNQPFYKDLAMRATQVLDQINPTPFRQKELEARRHKAQEILNHLKRSGVTSEQFAKEYGDSPFLREAYFENQDIFNNIFDLSHDAIAALFGGKNAQAKAYDFELESYNTYKTIAQRKLDNPSNYYKLSPKERATIEQRVGAIGSWWRNNSDKELVDHYLDLENAKESASNFVSAQKRLENVNSNEQFLGLIGALKHGKEFDKKQKAMIDDYAIVAKELGFDTLAYNKTGLYFIKDEKAYKVEQGLWDEIKGVFKDNIGSLAGAIAGAEYGYKKGKFKGMVAYGAAGAFGGGVTDSMIADVLANKKVDLAQALIHGAQEGALNIAADAVLKVAGTAIKTLNPEKLKNIAGTAIDYTPLLGFAKRAKDGNQAAAQKLIDHAIPQEAQADLKALESIFGAEVQIGATKTGQAQSALNSLESKLGSDSYIVKGAKSLYDTFAFTSQKQAQKDFIRAIRADESGNLSAFLSEAANASPVIQKNLLEILNQTSQKLAHQLGRFDLPPSTIKDVFDNFEKGTKQSYTDAIEQILLKVYDESYTTTLAKDAPNIPSNLSSQEAARFNTDSLESFKAKMEKSGVLLEDSAKFLRFVESTIYNPKGVTFETLNNAQKTLNAYYKQATDPNFRSFVKDAVNGFIKRDIQAGIEKIFAQNAPLYNDARTLFDTALSDYAKMKETLKLADSLKIRDSRRSYEQVAQSLSRFFLGQGDNIPNFEALLGGLQKELREQVELKLLQDMLELSFVKLNDIKVLDSSEFFKRLEPLKGHFHSTSAKDFIKIAQDFHTLFRNDASIARSLSPATTEKIGTSIATTLEGAVKFQVIKALFTNIIRLMPHIPFAKRLNESVQGSALRYQLKKALDSSLSVGEFKLELQARAIKGDFTNATREQIAKILGQVENAQESLEKATTPSTQAKPKANLHPIDSQEAKELAEHFHFKGAKPLVREARENEIAHALKSHGDETTEAQRGNIAITRADIDENYPKITQEHDEKFYTDTGVIYVKQVNGHHIVIEEALLGQDKLIFKTMWKTKGNYNKEVLLKNAKASPYLHNADEAAKSESISSPSLEQGSPLQSHQSTSNSTTLSPLEQAQAPKVDSSELPTKSNLERDLTLQEIKDIASKWDLNNPSADDKLIISKVEGDELAQLSKDFDFKGNYAVVREIDAQHLAHALNRHSDEASEASRNQIPITKDEALDYQSIIKTHDTREVSGNHIVYKKQINGHYVAVEEVLTGKNKLRFVTMWKSKGNITTTPTPSSKVTEPKGHDLDRTLSGSYDKGNSTTLSPLEQAQAQKQAEQAAQEATKLAQRQADQETAQAIKDKNDQIQSLKDSRAGKSEMEREVQLGQPIAMKHTEQPPTSIATDDNNIYQLDFVIVKASEVKPNFNADGLQPRTQKEHKTIESIAQNFKPEMVLGRGGYKDLPIIAKDGQVITGNHRVQGFKDFSPESRAAYEKAIKDRFNIELASDELLLRTPSDELSVKELLSIAYNSNKEDIKNLGDHIYSVLGRYAPNFAKLPRQLESSSVQELKSKIARILDPSPYPDENGANLALLANTIKADKNANITEMLNAFSKLDKENAARTLNTFTDTAGLWHILSNNAVEYGLKQLDLRPYLLGAMYKSATSQHTTRAANFKELNAQIKHILDTTDASGSNMMLEIMPNTYDNLIADLLGASLARFMRLENPSSNLYEALKGANHAIREQLAPRLDFEIGFTAGRNIEQADIFDFIEYMIRKGDEGKEVAEAVELLPKLREKYNAFKASTTPPNTPTPPTPPTPPKDTLESQAVKEAPAETPAQKVDSSVETKELHTKTTSKLTKDELDNLPIATAQEYGEFLEKIAQKDYQNTPEILKIATLNNDLQELINNNHSASVFITRARAGHISEARKGEYDQALTLEEQKQIPAEIAQAKQAYTDDKSGFILPFADKNNSEKINLIILDSDSKGNFLITAKKVNSAELNNPKYKKLARAGVEPATTTPPKAEQKPTEAISLARDEIIPQQTPQDGELLKKEYHRLKKEYDNLYNEKTKQLNKGLNPTKEQMRQIEKAYRALSKVKNRIFKEITQPARDFYVNFLTKYGNKSYFESLRQPIIRLGGKEELTTAADEIDSLAQDLVLLKQDLFKGIPETKINQEFARKTRLKMEKAFNIKPIAEFGENYAEHYRDGVGAIEKLLLEKQGQVAGAFHRKELGDIDLVWGEVQGKGKEAKGWGLAKIIEKHGDEFENIAKELDEIIRDGEVVKTHNGYNIELGDYKVGLNIGWNENGVKIGENKWVVTAFDKSKLQSEKQGSNSASLTKGETLPFNSSDIIPQTTQAKQSGKSVAETKELIDKELESINTQKIQEAKEKIKQLNKESRDLAYNAPKVMYLGRGYTKTPDKKYLDYRSRFRDRLKENGIGLDYMELEKLKQDTTLKGKARKEAMDTIYLRMYENMQQADKEVRERARAFSQKIREEELQKANEWLEKNKGASSDVDYEYKRKIAEIDTQLDLAFKKNTKDTEFIDLMNRQRGTLTYAKNGDLGVVRLPEVEKFYPRGYPMDLKVLQDIQKEHNYTDKKLILNGRDFSKPFEVMRAEIEARIGIKPIKEFGINYAEHYHSGESAIQKLLLEKQGQVAGAFYREGIGDITLAWGEKGTGKSDGWGLAKIAEYHPEVLDKLDKLIQDLPIVKETENRYKLDNGDFFISIRKDFNGEKQNWVLTALERDESIARRRTDLPSSQSEAEKTTSANASEIIPQSTATLTPQAQEYAHKILQGLRKTAQTPLNKLADEEPYSTDRGFMLRNARHKKQQAQEFADNFANLGWEDLRTAIQYAKIPYDEPIYRELVQNIKDKSFAKFIESKTPKVEQKSLFDTQESTPPKVDSSVESTPPKDTLESTSTPTPSQPHQAQKLKEALQIPLTDDRGLQSLAFGRVGSDAEIMEQVLIPQARNAYRKGTSQNKLEVAARNTLKKHRQDLEQSLNITPIKEFGTNYAEHYHSGESAIQKLLAEAQAHKQSGAKGEYKGQVAGAFWRKELGDIDLVWGDSSKGLEHIIERRKQDFIEKGFSEAEAEQKALEFVKSLPDIIENGNIDKGTQRVFLDTENERAVIALDYNGIDRKWVLTGYIKDDKAPISAYPHQNKLTDSTSSPIVKSALTDEIIPQPPQKSLFDTQAPAETPAPKVDSSVAPPSRINFTYTTGEAKGIAELRKDLKAALEPYKSTPITNKETGLQGVVTDTERNKISSKKAVDKSIANGFTRDEYFTAAQDLKNLFENATKAQSHNDYKQRENIAQVHRFVKDLYINDKQAQAKITLFEKIEGKNRIYTLELESLNKPDPLSASVPNTESAAKAQSVATARPETTTIAKTDGRDYTTNTISNIKKQLVELKQSKSAYEKYLKSLERNMKDVELEERTYLRGEERIKVFERKRLIQSSIDEHTQDLNATLKKMIELHKQLPENVRYTKEVLDDLTKIEAILKGNDYSLKQALRLSKITQNLQEKAIIESESFLNEVYKLDDFAKGAKSLQGTSYAYNTDESIKRYFKTIAEMIDSIPAFKKISANPKTLPKVDSSESNHYAQRE